MLVENVRAFIEAIGSLRVLVVGETIIDEFIEVQYEGQSMKSFCPVFKLHGGRSEQMGGASAIASHLKDFVEHVDILTNENREIVKTRYIDPHGGKKHAEINHFNAEGFKQLKVDTEVYDVVILADFGHGFCDKIEISDGFHLMCQTNSNNFGFNRVSKWKTHRKKSVCLDLREASLQMNRRIKRCTDQELLELYNYELNTDHLFVTLGKEGSFFTNGNYIDNHGTFQTQVIDTIGAGDTFFAFASLASAINWEDNKKLIVPSLAASLSTTWLCNEKSVTKKSLLDHANRFISEKV